MQRLFTILILGLLILSAGIAFAESFESHEDTCCEESCTGGNCCTDLVHCHCLQLFGLTSPAASFTPDIAQSIPLVLERCDIVLNDVVFSHDRPPRAIA